MPRLVAGSIGSIVTAIAVTPLEVVKVRQQASTLPSNVAPCPRGCRTFVLNNGIMDCVLPRSAVPYFDRCGQYCSGAFPRLSRTNPTNIGTFGMLHCIFIKEGVSGIYAGLAPTLAMSAPNTVLYFSPYDEIVSQLRRRMSHSNFWHAWVPLVSGTFGMLTVAWV